LLEFKHITSLPIETTMTSLSKTSMNEKVEWFLHRVPLVWLFLTAAIIAAVLHSIYKSGGLH